MECSIVEYYEMLLAHDWYYSFSDDHSVYQNGEKEVRRLMDIAAEKGLDYMRMWKQFNQAMFSGEPWGTPKMEIPRINEFL